METAALSRILATALSDGQLKPLCRAEIERKVLLAAARSPQALRHLADELAGCTHADTIIADLADEALPQWRDQRLVGAFLDWFERSPRRESVRARIHQWRRAWSGRNPKQESYSGPQQRVLERLHQLADLYQFSQNRSWTIRPRTNPLIVAPSGSGKSHVVEAFAKERGAAFLRLTYGNWVVRGARSGTPTLWALADFVSRHPFTVLCIDELDKIGHGLSSDWSVAMRDELFAVLDRRALDGIQLKEDPARVCADAGRALREMVMIIGCATFQNLWGVEGRSVGFGREHDVAQLAEQIEGNTGIAEELRRRFCQRLLVLPPLSAAELREFARTDGLDDLAASLGVVVDYQEGAESGLGMRWLEGLRTDLELVRSGADARELGYAVGAGAQALGD